MRVALFLPDLGGGGAERVFALLAQGLVARGVDAKVVLVKAQGAHLEAVRRTVPVVDLDVRATRYSLPGLIRYLRRDRPDLLVTALDHTSVLAVWACWLARVPTRVVITHHLSSADPGTGRPSFKHRVLGLLDLNRRSYPRADAIVAVSRDAAIDLASALRLPPARIDVIYNPVITPDLVARSEEPLDHPWFAEGEPPVVLGIGRLVPAKDFSTLISAFAIARRQRPLRLVVLGEGPGRAELEAQVAALGVGADVSLHGFVPNPYAWLHRAAVFALSSVLEGLPTVLIEALAVGTPVVSTDCETGPREILDDGRIGRLVPIEDPSALAEAIGATLDGSATQATPEDLKPFLVSEAVDAYIRLFERVLTSAGSTVTPLPQEPS